ncbi:hypothetical protein AVEN_153424-1 [Araneus ventricosus]|uniref:Uncharacterized protein n=1 Tax=Araneus ventricosus TaxID=182803 RepID=A0A4Y2E7U3_ARAVE|nr:hypothetical protein AVEN_153424-1 [Araneus ventricosus]
MGPLNDSRCNSSSTEAGVLIANHLATARSLPKEVRTISDGAVFMAPYRDDAEPPSSGNGFIIPKAMISHNCDCSSLSRGTKGRKSHKPPAKTSQLLAYCLAFSSLRERRKKHSLAAVS